MGAVKTFETYVRTVPSAQNVVDLFAGEWASHLPETAGATATPGKVPLFADGRIAWLDGAIGGFDGKRVLELGPLEGGHTAMMHDRGAAAIVAVEAHPRAFLKCLCVKELLGLDRARFLLGDGLEYLRACDERFDLALASGLLYHLDRPHELLRHLARAADAVFLWTHYYDEERLRLLPRKLVEFDPPREVAVDGNRYVMATCHYGRQRFSIRGRPRRGLAYPGFCGGGNATAEWFTRDSLIQALGDVGLRVESTAFDEPDHEQGPAMALLARRAARPDP